MTQAANKTEVIRYGDKEFPLGGLTLDQAKDVMARHFPELANPKIEKKVEGDKTVHVFSKQAGTKGASDSELVAQRLIGSVIEFMPISPALTAIAQAFIDGGEPDTSEVDEAEITRAGQSISSEQIIAHRAHEQLLTVPSAWRTQRGGLL